MRKFGLIGYPLSHSFSPGYFAARFEREGIDDARYDLYPLEEISTFCDLLKDDLQGLNVTIPYKEKVIPFLDELTPAAKAIGAVNVIDLRGGRSTGHNSDVYGFRVSLESCWGKPPSGALVLGTGGAAKAVWYVLNELRIPFLKVSRSKGDLLYQDITPDHLNTHPLVINTTPLGMSPQVDSCPELPYEALTEQNILFDLVYNPSVTLFLQKGAEVGATVKNGYDMLTLQAERSWEIWNS
ncbi:MAG: shikimate dehydrogenase [Bacteroidota bacterium]